MRARAPSRAWRGAGRRLDPSGDATKMPRRWGRASERRAAESETVRRRRRGRRACDAGAAELAIAWALTCTGVLVAATATGCGGDEIRRGRRDDRRRARRRRLDRRARRRRRPAGRRRRSRRRPAARLSCALPDRPNAVADHAVRRGQPARDRGARRRPRRAGLREGRRLDHGEHELHGVLRREPRRRRRPRGPHGADRVLPVGRRRRHDVVRPREHRGRRRLDREPRALRRSERARARARGHPSAVRRRDVRDQRRRVSLGVRLGGRHARHRRSARRPRRHPDPQLHPAARRQRDRGREGAALEHGGTCAGAGAASPVRRPAPRADRPAGPRSGPRRRAPEHGGRGRLRARRGGPAVRLQRAQPRDDRGARSREDDNRRRAGCPGRAGRARDRRRLARLARRGRRAPVQRRAHDGGRAVPQHRSLRRLQRDAGRERARAALPARGDGADDAPRARARPRDGRHRYPLIEGRAHGRGLRRARAPGESGSPSSPGRGSCRSTPTSMEPGPSWPASTCWC